METADRKVTTGREQLSNAVRYKVGLAPALLGGATCRHCCHLFLSSSSIPLSLSLSLSLQRCSRKLICALFIILMVILAIIAIVITVLVVKLTRK